MTARLLLCALATAGLAGCYTLGDARPSMMRGIATLAVPVSQNETLEPNVEALLADTITKQIQSDGTYAISYERDADATLFTKLKEVRRYAARSVRGNVLAASEYVLFTNIEYRVITRDGSEELMSGEITGRTSFFVTADLQTDEIQALPLAFSDAAVKLSAQLSEGF